VHICTAVPPKNFNIAQSLQEALSHHQQGQLREAEKLYTRIIKIAPGNFDALHLLGLAKAQGGQMGEAYRLMSAALKINPNVPDVLINYANVLHALKRDREALETLDKALALRPGDEEALLYRGNALVALNRAEEAIVCFDTVLKRQPGRDDARANRGNAFALLGRHADALGDFDAVLAHRPNDPECLYNRATALLNLGRSSEAILGFDRALAAAPNHLKALNNRGRALQTLNRHDEALACFEKAISIEKNYADAHFNAALSLLTVGQLNRGFSEYEWRWMRSGMPEPRRQTRGRLWRGEFPLDRRTILLSAEQGLGDTIQFARYAPVLAAAGATVILEVQPELKPLLANLAGVASCHSRGEPLPPYDLYCPLGSLPFALKTDLSTVPADIPYLNADAAHIAKWRPALEALSGKRIAIAWAGHVRRANDRNRSIELQLLERLFSLDGISWVSIQHELRDGDAQLLRRNAILDLGPQLADMADTAAVLANVDLVISVDTSVVHLGGAMDREVWVLLPFSPDWRWTLKGEHSPWYPRTRLFRQSAPAQWTDAIEAVRDALLRVTSLG
jgi:tetratricopeptide (TPR) repeat protein